MILRFMQAVNVMETVNLVLGSGNVENISSANLIFLALSGGWKGPFDFPFFFALVPTFLDELAPKRLLRRLAQHEFEKPLRSSIRLYDWPIAQIS